MELLLSWFIRWCGNFRYERDIDGARFFVAADQRTRQKHFKDCVAFTLGEDVFVETPRSLTPKNIAHELEHVHQCRRYGNLRFTVLYWLENLQRGYEHNHFEVEARRAGRQAGKRAP
jgi:hypothetical protein